MRWNRIFLIVVIITLLSGAVIGTIQVYNSVKIDDEKLPPGANTFGDISNPTKLIDSHNEIVMGSNVQLRRYRYVDSEEYMTYIDRDDQQAHTIYQFNAEPPHKESYQVSGDEYWMEYRRIPQSRGDIGYIISGYDSKPNQLQEPPYGTALIRTGLSDYEWELQNITDHGNGIYFSHFNLTGYSDDDIEDSDGPVADRGRIVIRNDGLIVEYWERGHVNGLISQGPYHERVTINLTEDDVVTEPSWTTSAKEDEEDDGTNPWECDEDDIDGDGDGLCNER